jgi:hypothetical protein
MSAVKREFEAFENMKLDLEQIALKTGAIRTDDDGEFVSNSSAQAENHAYAEATNIFKRGRWNATLPEIRDAMRDILDGVRFGNRDA